MEGISFKVTKAVGEQELRPEYDLVIIGGGPAGLTAAIYASRSRMRTLLVEKEAIGGEAASMSMIENYPGFPEGISGAELAKRMRSQAQKFGAQIVLATPESLDLRVEPKEVTLEASLFEPGRSSLLLEPPQGSWAYQVKRSSRGGCFLLCNV